MTGYSSSALAGEARTLNIPIRVTLGQLELSGKRNGKFHHQKCDNSLRMLYIKRQRNRQK
jgi:hypothetical protein